MRRSQKQLTSSTYYTFKVISSQQYGVDASELETESMHTTDIKHIQTIEAYNFYRIETQAWRIFMQQVEKFKVEFF